MKEYKVVHKTYGPGVVIEMDDKYAIVRFANKESKFLLNGFNNFFKIEDEELLKLVQRANTLTVNNQAKVASTSRDQMNLVQSKKTYISASTSVSTNSLLGSRAQTISVSDESELFEIVGYMAHPGRVSSFEAEVPADGRHKQFELLFPGQIYRPIAMGSTPSGMPNKLSAQFRINFSNLRNCPPVLRANMGAGNSSCAGRINKSRFVIMMVEKYGFKFGEYQDVNRIRQIAEEKGHLDDFEKGYSR